jgi:peptidoglycan/xylan/chitin deacetylase (PgdA/CDA1 family)
MYKINGVVWIGLLVLNNIGYAQEVKEVKNINMVKNHIMNNKAIILAYHGISSKPSSMNTSLIRFKEQIDYLIENKYHFLSLPELVKAIEEKKVIPNKSIVLTFDDGWKNQNLAMEYLSVKKIPAAFGLVSSFQNTNSKITLQLEDIKKYKDSNFIYINHSYTHNPKDYLYHSENDVKKSKAVLEKIVPFYPYYIYPYGRQNPALISALKANGYKVGLDCNPAPVNLNGSISLFHLPRYLVNEKVTIEKLKDIINQ